MRYTMKAGALYRDDSKEVLVKMKSALNGPEKRIYRDGEGMTMKTGIRYPDSQKEYSGDIRNKEYIMTDGGDTVIAVGRPGYARGDGLEEAGRPVRGLPRIDRASLTVENQRFFLTMHDSRHYSLRDGKNDDILRILHKGLSGGWSIEDNHGFSLEIICGIFAFCRYIEQENEFLIV